MIIIILLLLLLLLLLFLLSTPASLNHLNSFSSFFVCPTLPISSFFFYISLCFLLLSTSLLVSSFSLILLLVPCLPFPFFFLSCYFFFDCFSFTIVFTIPFTPWHTLSLHVLFPAYHDIPFFLLYPSSSSSSKFFLFSSPFLSFFLYFRLSPPDLTIIKPYHVKHDMFNQVISFALCHSLFPPNYSLQ